MIRIIASLFLFSLSAVCLAQSYGSVKVSQIGTVIDGDSFKVDIDGWPAIIGDGITVRINGIDTPEMRGKCEREKRMARKAKQFTVEKLRSAKQVKLKNIQRGKYFRIIADVDIDGKDLGFLLLDAGLAVVYSAKRNAKTFCL